MNEEPPTLIAINHDDYHAEHIGRTPDGRQFFLTALFEPAVGDSEGCEYVALFLFDLGGILMDHKIESFGPRAQMDKDKRTQTRDRWLAELATEAIGQGFLRELFTF